MDDFDKFISDLAGTEIEPGAFVERTTFPCQQCRGTGKWSGGTNRHGNSDCLACKGRGHFVTSEADRRKARQQIRDRKTNKVSEAQAVFEETYPGLADFLSKATWSDFAVSLHGQLRTKGWLSEGQVRAARSMQAKAAAKVKPSTDVDLGAIRAMFEKAVTSGYKRPVYRAEGLIISRAPDHGRNPGALYVKEGEDYLGKVLGTKYMGKPAPALTAIAADPEAAAVRYGRLTGTCACCGRELTNAKSIELGIGPICRERWF